MRLLEAVHRLGRRARRDEGTPDPSSARPHVEGGVRKRVRASLAVGDAPESVEEDQTPRSQGDDGRPCAAGTFYGDWARRVSDGHPHVASFFKGRTVDAAAARAQLAASVLADPFETFAKQAAMFAWADGRAACAGEPELRYFAAETAGGKSRAYIATTLRRFWRHYAAMPSGARHYYELIREGAPCNMYFDLEFARREGEGAASVDGDALVALTVALCRAELVRMFGPADGHFAQEAVVELDSSTPTKFSRHVIIPLPNRGALASNAHAGAVARAVVRAAQGRLAVPPSEQTAPPPSLPPAPVSGGPQRVQQEPNVPRAGKPQVG